MDTEFRKISEKAPSWRIIRELFGRQCPVSPAKGAMIRSGWTPLDQHRDVARHSRSWRLGLNTMNGYRSIRVPMATSPHACLPKLTANGEPAAPTNSISSKLLILWWAERRAAEGTRPSRSTAPTRCYWPRSFMASRAICTPRRLFTSWASFHTWDFGSPCDKSCCGIANWIRAMPTKQRLAATSAAWEYRSSGRRWTPCRSTIPCADGRWMS